MRVFAVLAALHGTGCTLLFDESQYLGGAGGGDGGRGGDGGGTAGAGGGGPSVCDDATCGPSPLPVYLLTPAGESVQAKVDAIRDAGKRVILKKSGNGGEQDCGIAWDGDQVLIGCLPSVTDWYLLVELESDGEFVAHQLSEGDGFTTDCTSFACTGAQADSGSLTGAQFEADGNAVVVSVPVSSVGTSFSVALEIGSTIIAEMPASFPATAGESAAAERYECTRPVSCE